MEGIIDDTQFAFITYYGAKLPNDSRQRTLIRRRAMRDVAETRKQRAAQNSRNLEQCPPTATITSINSITTQAKIDPNNRNQYGRLRLQRQKTEHYQAVWQRCPPISPPLSSTYSALLVTERFSILNLAPLTGLRLGVTTLSFFTKDPTKITQALSTSVPGSQRFMSFIPPRYGHVTSLSHAADCIVAKLRQMLIKNNSASGQNVVLRHHIKALECVQHDLNDKNLCLSSETLCAIQLLGLFDLISNASLQSWLCHAAGASRLIEHRGPQHFRTDFDLALFAAQIGPIVTEAILDNRNCFLTNEAWKMVICRAILCDDYFADYSDIIICLWTHLAWGPNHFKSVTDLITAAKAFSPQDYASLIEDMKKHSESLLYLTNLLQTRLTATGSKIQSTDDTISSTSNKHRWRIDPLEIQGTIILCRLMKSRLLFAMEPNRFSALESESQTLASQAINLETQLSKNKDSKIIGGLFTSQITWIAKATTETHDIWKTSVGNKGMIEKWKFEAWCYAIGRKTHFHS